MAANAKIELADYTFNGWKGCTKVSHGCENCCAEAGFRQHGCVAESGAGKARQRTVASTWAEPLRWNRKAQRLGVRYRVLCKSLADVFEVPVAWRVELFALIRDTPNLDWLLLTKRIGNAHRMLNEVVQQLPDKETGVVADRNWEPGDWPNVWLGATVCNQTEADHDVEKLLSVPVAMRFVSMEPLLGPVSLSLLLPNNNHSGLAWVIVGGESGHRARPLHPDWVRSLRNECRDLGIAFLYTQWGEWVDVVNGPQDDQPYEGTPLCWVNIQDGSYSVGVMVNFFGCHPMYRVGKRAAGRQLDGIEWNGIPVMEAAPC